MKKKLQDDALGKTIPDAVKILLKMKLTLCVILFSFLGAMASDSYSQTTKLSLDLKNAKVKDALGAIENQSEFFFLYSEKLINVNREVNIEVRGSTIEKILDKIFEGTDVNYTVKGRQIILATPEANNIVGTYSVSQQQKRVSGKVTDSTGGSLPGVSVVVKGTTTGVITDNSGNYALSNIPDNAILQFSFVGMKTQEFVIENKTTINVVLEEETVSLEEVVAVGYGTIKRASITGSIATIGADKLTIAPVASTTNALTGRMPGLITKQVRGLPGSDAATLSIRGFDAPLVIIDGVEASLNNIDANEIESISVLKDASAAIYGSRAGNGVVLITTRRGTLNKPVFVLNSTMTIQGATFLPKLASAAERLTDVVVLPTPPF